MHAPMAPNPMMRPHAMAISPVSLIETSSR
jgi:hypothetical protein